MTLLVLIVIQKKGHLSCGSIRALCTLRSICNTTSTICITNRNSVFPDDENNIRYQEREEKPIVGASIPLGYLPVCCKMKSVVLQNGNCNAHPTRYMLLSKSQ